MASTSGDLLIISSDDDSDDGGTATADKLGVKHVDTEKCVKNVKGEAFGFIMKCKNTLRRQLISSEIYLIGRPKKNYSNLPVFIRSNGSMHRHFDNFKI